MRITVQETNKNDVYGPEKLLANSVYKVTAIPKFVAGVWPGLQVNCIVYTVDFENVTDSPDILLITEDGCLLKQKIHCDFKFQYLGKINHTHIGTL